MRRGTLVFLVLLVGVLGWLALERRREQERGGPALGEYPLGPALVLERVRSVRIEHLERGLSIQLERDAQGRWFLTDPVEYPAQGALVRTFLTTLADARGEPVKGVALAELGLDPPKIVVECQEVDPDGERTLRFEFGALDHDSSRVLARVPGHPAAATEGEVFATTRALVNTLERNADDYRDPKATGLLAQEVVALRRSGIVYQAEAHGRVALELEALAGPDGWKTTQSPIVTLAPDAMGLLARGATDLTIERFVDDAPRDYARYGLDVPAFTVELETLAGQKTRLAFGLAPGAPEQDVGAHTWFCRRDEYAHVWEVRTRDVELLTRPSALFYEQSLLRVLREEIVRVELDGGGARRVLARTKSGWDVRELAGATDGEGPSYPAETSEVEAALATLERAQLPEHLRERFEPEEPALGFTVELKNGARLGGRIGRATRDPESGAVGRQFLRDGDELVAVLGEDVAEVCRTPAGRFRSKRVHQHQESLVRLVELTHAGTSYSFLNDGNNAWTTRGTTLAAPEPFQLALDPLLNLAARRWLEPGEERAGEEVLAVRLALLQGEPVSFSFLRCGDGAVLCVRSSGERAEVDPALLERLLGLF